MSEKSAGYAHLRVRISESDKSFLRSLSAKNGSRPNISRAVKLMIEKTREGREPLSIPKSTLRDIQCLAKALRRTPAQVTHESIAAILEMIDDDQIPLIVMELRLAKKYLGSFLKSPRRNHERL